MIERTIDLRPVLRSDGLYRMCRVCGEEFKLASDTVVAEVKQHHNGIRYTTRVERTDNYPRALVQTVCPKCQQAAAPDPPRRRHIYKWEKNC